MLSQVLMESLRLTGRTLLKETGKYVYYYTNEPFAMTVHICWSCNRDRNPVLLSLPRPYQTQQDPHQPRRADSTNKSICCSRGVASLPPCLWPTESKKSDHCPVGRRGHVLHLGAQKGRAKWKLGIQTDSQRCRPEDVAPRLHSASDTA